MLLSAVDWTAATVYVQASAANCYKGCKWSRMLPLVLSQEPQDQSIMTPVLRGLHWLPVQLRITFKTAVLVYKCLHGMALQYLQTYCEPTSTVTSRRLRSAHSSRLTLPRTRTNYGDQLHRPRTSGVEQSSFWTVYTGHHALNVQKQTLEFCSTCNLPVHSTLAAFLRSCAT